MAQNQHLLAQKKAAEQAQSDAQEAIAAEKKEREILEKERLDRE